MTETVRELHEKALNLRAEERAALLELLLASLEPQSVAQRAWSQLASRRRDDVSAGRVQMIAGHEALAGIRSKLA